MTACYVLYERSKMLLRRQAERVSGAGDPVAAPKKSDAHARPCREIAPLNRISNGNSVSIRIASNSLKINDGTQFYPKLPPVGIGRPIYSPFIRHSVAGEPEESCCG